MKPFIIACVLARRLMDQKIRSILVEAVELSFTFLLKDEVSLEHYSFLVCLRERERESEIQPLQNFIFIFLPFVLALRVTSPHGLT